jgi:hypothetical protein
MIVDGTVTLPVKAHRVSDDFAGSLRRHVIVQLRQFESLFRKKLSGGDEMRQGGRLFSARC